MHKQFHLNSILCSIMLITFFILQVNEKVFVKKCPNPDDVCGMSYTSSIDTLEKIGFNRSCTTLEEQREISKYGPDRNVRKKEKDSKSGFFQLVQVTYSTCNVSLCNGRYESDSEYLKCYICSSPNAPDCDYEGTMLVSMNNTFLSRFSNWSKLVFNLAIFLSFSNQAYLV